MRRSSRFQIGHLGIQVFCTQLGQNNLNVVKYIFCLIHRKKSQTSSRSRSLVPCNAAGGILEYTDYVKVYMTTSQKILTPTKNAAEIPGEFHEYQTNSEY